LKRVESVRLPLVASVFPFESLRNAEFMANEVPGSQVPDELIARMRRADNEGGATQEGIAIAREIAAVLKPSVQGIQVASASGNVEAASAILDGLR